MRGGSRDGKRPHSSPFNCGYQKVDMKEGLLISTPAPTPVVFHRWIDSQAWSRDHVQLGRLPTARS